MTKTILLAAGGTGGHLYPAEALAEEMLSRGYRVFIVTDKRGAAFQALGDRVQIDCVRAATFGAGVVTKVKAVANITLGIIEAARLLRKIKPDVVVGFGGYPSFPAVFAAGMLGYKTVLHEQNAVLGKANRVLASRAVKIALSLPDTKGLTAADQIKTIVTGNPVRAGICAVRDAAYPPVGDKFTIFVTGGSQAATVFNDIVPAAVAALPADLRAKIRVMQQVRASGVDTVAAAYAKAGIEAEVKPFFADMPARLAGCHLFIGRSGASTVAEIAVAGRPAVFVPYPGHADQQQLHNAQLIAARNGGWVIPQPDFTADHLARQIAHLMQQPDMLAAAARAAKACGEVNAAAKLADVVAHIS